MTGDGSSAPTTPATLTAWSDLVYWLLDAEDAAGAAAANVERLQNLLRMLGPNHPDTLDTRHQLAFWQARSGRPGCR
ncbi:hypothetical protein [Kitasatospora sp. A2-31]|uniref:hypothetical protein n=1 Tax=Kitasatospora sp. A2-31 TaxID=2916414 RepID=UPI001EEF73B4|nr:hypothetical protein [Kitasatospora sp. A2-31]MCG6498844.1 hypothetical protein [Kitasatospora sp. A2-31]